MPENGKDGPPRQCFVSGVLGESAYLPQEARLRRSCQWKSQRESQTDALAPPDIQIPLLRPANAFRTEDLGPLNGPLNGTTCSGADYEATPNLILKLSSAYRPPAQRWTHREY